jgi:hypothetical protein
MTIREQSKTDHERPADALDYTPRSYSLRETIITAFKLSAVVGLAGGLLWVADVLLAR